MEENVKGMEDEVEGGIWPTQKFWRSAPYTRHLTGRGKGKGRERNGKGEEGQEKWKESWNRAPIG